MGRRTAGARRVARRLAGPWGWCLAALGVALAVASGSVYLTPSPGADGPDPESAGWPRGVSVYAGHPCRTIAPSIDARHRRAIGVVIVGPDRRFPSRPGDAAGPTDAQRRWTAERSAPAWGLSWEGWFGGDLDPAGRYPDQAGGTACRVMGAQAGAA